MHEAGGGIFDLGRGMRMRIGAVFMRDEADQVSIAVFYVLAGSCWNSVSYLYSSGVKIMQGIFRVGYNDHSIGDQGHEHMQDLLS